MPLELFATMIPDNLSDSYFDNLLSLLPEDRIVRIRKFVHRKNALHTLAGEMLTRCWISKKRKCPPIIIKIHRDEFGKPVIENTSDIFFNIAHSGKWVVSAFDSNEVGIDIEFMRDIDLQIAERFFTKKEHSALLQKNSDQQKAFFYELWTLKESYIKAEGKGLSIPLDSFCFSIDNNEAVHFELLSGNGKHEYYFHKYSIDPQYKCAVCACSNKFPEIITILKFDDLCQEFLNFSSI